MTRPGCTGNESFRRTFTSHDLSGQLASHYHTREGADRSARSAARCKIFLDCAIGFAQQYSIPCLNVPPAAQESKHVTKSRWYSCKHICARGDGSASSLAWA